MAIPPRHPPVYVTNMGEMAGGASLATSANQEALLTAIGTPADAPYSGTGPGTVIAILKAIEANTRIT